jgi:hypothetical protein
LPTLTNENKFNEQGEKVRGFEPWMISNFAVGAAASAFIILLIPPSSPQ